MKKALLYILGVVYILFVLTTIMSDGFVNGIGIVSFITGIFLLTSGIIKILIDGSRDMRFKKNKEAVKHSVTWELIFGGIVLIGLGNYILPNLTDTTKSTTDKTELSRDSIPKKEKK